MTGVDVSASGIRHARENYGHRVKFHCAEISRDLAPILGRNCFDLVISIEVLPHLSRPFNLLAVAGELLTADGYFLVTTPYHGYFKNLLISLAGHTDRHFDPLCDNGHIKFFSVKTLDLLLRESSFAPVRYSFFGRWPWLWKSIVGLAQKKRPIPA